MQPKQRGALPSKDRVRLLGEFDIKLLKAGVAVTLLVDFVREEMGKVSSAAELRENIGERIDTTFTDLHLTDDEALAFFDTVEEDLRREEAKLMGAGTTTRADALSADERTQKIIVGVIHKDEEEVRKVADGIKQYSHTRVGLELPEDYLEREESGIKIFFFGKLASELRSSGIDVVPLEDPELWDRHHAIELAIDIRSGKIEEEGIRDAVEVVSKAMKDPREAPEMKSGAEFDANRCKMAFEILEETDTLDDVIALWKDSNSKREVHVLKKSREAQLPAIVVGEGHTPELRDSMPEYNYVTFD